MNKCIFTGRLTKDPVLTFTPGTGTAITKFTLAVERPQFDKSKQKEADFINCTCFGKRAEAIANYVQKGHLFGVTGRLQISKYVDKDNNNRWSTDIMVDDFEFFPNKTDGAASTQSNSKPPQQNKPPEYEEIDYNDSEIPFN